MTTKAQYFAQIAAVCQFLESVYQDGSSNALPRIQDIEDVLDGNSIQAVVNALTTARKSLSSAISQGSQMLNPLLIELARVHYNSKSSTVAIVLDDLLEGMYSASETILERDLTLGSVVYGTNTGTGRLYRSTTNAQGDTVQGGWVGAVGAVAARCVSDRHTGRPRGQESWVVEGDGAGKYDEIELGDTISSTLSIDSSITSNSLLQNSGFETQAGSSGGADFELDRWTISSQTAFDTETTSIFRPAPGSTTGKSLKVVANASIEQTLPASNVVLDPSRPVYLIARYNRQVGAAAGTLTLRLGSQTESVVLAAQTGWQDLVLGLDSKGWYENFKEDNSGAGVRIKLEATGLTGYLLLDDVILRQPVLFNGHWYLLTSGTIDWLRDDSATWTDTEIAKGVIQYWLARIYGKYLPYAPAAPTYPD